jgi:predicted Zn-dependent peptidase
VIPFLVAVAATQLVRLPNGIPIIVRTEPDASVVAIEALVRADDLSVANQAMLETMVGAVFGETDSFTAAGIRELGWSIGGGVTCSLAGGALRFEIVTLKSHLEPAMTLLVDVLRRPLFTESSLDQGWLAYLEGRTSIAREPGARAVRALLAGLGAAPQPAIRPRATEARFLYNWVVRPERIVISVCGNVEADAVTRLLTSSLGGWEPAEKPEARRGAGRTIFPVPRNCAVVAFSGPKPNEEGFAAWMTLAYLIGGGKGSIAYRELRDKRGWSYSTGLALAFDSDASWAAVYGAFKEVDAEEVKGRNKALAEALDTAVSATNDEVERAKGLLIGQYLVGIGRQIGPFLHGHNSQAERAYWLAWWEMKGAGWRMDSAFTDRVAKVQPGEVRALAASMKKALPQLIEK